MSWWGPLLYQDTSDGPSFPLFFLTFVLRGLFRSWDSKTFRSIFFSDLYHRIEKLLFFSYVMPLFLSVCLKKKMVVESEAKHCGFSLDLGNILLSPAFQGLWYCLHRACRLQWLILLRVTSILPSFVSCASGRRRGFSYCESIQMYRKNIKNSIINLSLPFKFNNC